MARGNCVRNQRATTIDSVTSPDAPPTSVEEAASILYGLPADEFVAGRDEMVKVVRSGGERSLAGAIKALRKPTVVADALNQALRRDPDVVEGLLDAVAELRRTQDAMLAGQSDAGAGSFVARQTAYRAAVDAVVALAPGHHVEVRVAVEAAATGGLAGELRAATFAVAPQPQGGFGPFVAGSGTSEASVAGAAGAAGAAGTRPGRSTVPDRSPRRSADRTNNTEPSAAERRLAERARKAAEKILADADVEYRAAEAAVIAAKSAVDVLDERLSELTAALDEARHARDDAVAVRAAADASLATAHDKREQAQSALQRLGGS